MAESNMAKYLITDVKPGVILPAFRTDKPGQPSAPGQQPKMDHVVWLDDTVIPGAKIYSECVWFWPGSIPPVDAEKVRSGEQGLKEHSHPFDEVLAFFGTDNSKPRDLCGELELWLDGEKHMITKTSLVFIPSGMKHGPLVFHRIDKPIFHFSIGSTGKYR